MGETSEERAEAEPPGGEGPPAELSPATAAERLLEAVRDDESPDPFLSRLANAADDDLAAVRSDRRVGRAFWLNVYNAAAQLLLERRPGRFDSRVRFFRTDVVTVGGVTLSLDDIEHGVLRGGRSKYGLGYLPRLASTGLDRSYRLDADPRVHFALNCGAASCPAVRAYTPETIDETLEYATRRYLDETVTYDPDRDRVRVPRPCLWFVGDFGGLSGVRQFLRAFDQIPAESSPSLRFHRYDWTKDAGNFADDDRPE